MNPERLIAFTQALVRTPSLSGEEGAVVELVLAEMRALGFDRVWADENGSAIGVIEGARPGPTLLLDAHCDTVGIAPGSTWTRDPFGAEIDGGYLYGRGTADMKGALAAMIHAAAAAYRFCTNAAYSAASLACPPSASARQLRVMPMWRMSGWLLRNCWLRRVVIVGRRKVYWPIALMDNFKP
jgi:hypothetical protein